MRFREILTEAAVRIISPQQAKDAEMFGPMYHGTQRDLADIVQTGFNPKYSVPSAKLTGWNNRPVGTSNGMSLAGYGFSGISAPVHWLGYGTYMTSVKAIAKAFSGGTMKGQRTFYLDSKRVLKINFGSPRTMMRWWMENGYDMTAEATKNRDVKAWIKATGNLTRNLRQNYDAVWFLGKGIRKLLDGDQVCVYNTKLICVVEPKLATGLEIGAKVTHTQQLRDDYVGRNVLYVDDLKPDDFRSAGNLAGKGWRGVYRADTEDSDNKVGRYPIHFIPPPGMVGTIVEKRGESFDVKWQVGGVRYNYHASELEPFKR